MLNPASNALATLNSNLVRNDRFGAEQCDSSSLHGSEDMYWVSAVKACTQGKERGRKPVTPPLYPRDLALTIARHCSAYYEPPDAG